MRRILGWLAAFVLVTAAAIGGWIYHTITSLEHEKLTDDVHVIFGLGGNVGVLGTDAGTVVVDSMTFPIQGERIAALAEELTGQPVVLVVNTHYHQDHTHGNPGFAAGTRVVSTTATRAHLLARDGEFWKGDAAALLPTETFEHEHLIVLGGKTIRLLHLGRGHTDGDLVASFVEDRVIHSGDLCFNGRYPNIDLEAGGSIREWDATLGRVIGLDFDRVIPGHGPVTDADGLRRFQRFVRDLWRAGKEAADAGWTLAETLAETRLTENDGMEPFSIPFVIRFDRDFVVRRAWEEATGAVTAGDPS